MSIPPHAAAVSIIAVLIRDVLAVPSRAMLFRALFDPQATSLEGTPVSFLPAPFALLI
jgi:hypothetical protein